MMPQADSMDGALLVDKPSGPTSHDVVDAIRRHFHIRKVGHCGTLDPGATGLLVLVLGRGTKLSERLMGEDKVYEGIIKLGESTTSHDADGDLTASLPVPALSLDELNEVAGGFLGDQMQVPPMVSAIKREGVPLYKLARKGVEVERKERFIHIYSFRISSYDEPLARFRVACTKGTYLRTLAHDFGRKIGCGAHLASLRRTVSGRFNVTDALSLAEVLQLSSGELEQRIIPMLKLAAG